MRKSIFITGTGTDVGKTFVSALILKELVEGGHDSGYYKPVLSGAVCEKESLHPGDCEYVIDFAGLQQVPLKSLTYVFEEAVSPHLAARNLGVKIDKNEIIKGFNTFNQEYLLVEGAGGITCPLEIDNEIRKIINECYNKAKEVLSANADLVKLIASHLMEIETLTKEDIYELVESGKLSWWEKKKAKQEAEKIAKEKEAELQEIYRKQLEAMEKSKEATTKEEKPEE